MAETKVSARDYILTADIDGDATFKAVACLTTNSMTSTVNTIDATSKCGDQYQAGPSFTQSFKAKDLQLMKQELQVRILTNNCTPHTLLKLPSI